MVGDAWPITETNLSAGRDVDDDDDHRNGLLTTIAAVDPPDDAGDLADLIDAAKLNDRERLARDLLDLAGSSLTLGGFSLY